MARLAVDLAEELLDCLDLVLVVQLEVLELDQSLACCRVCLEHAGHLDSIVCALLAVG